MEIVVACGNIRLVSGADMMRSLVGRIRRMLSSFRTQITSPLSTMEKQAIRRLRDNPCSLVLWLDLIGLSVPEMSEALRDQIQSHHFTRCDPSLQESACELYGC
jgi:hypothetical protein